MGTYITEGLLTDMVRVMIPQPTLDHLLFYELAQRVDLGRQAYRLEVFRPNGEAQLWLREKRGHASFAAARKYPASGSDIREGFRQIEDVLGGPGLMTTGRPGHGTMDIPTNWQDDAATKQEYWERYFSSPVRMWSQRKVFSLEGEPESEEPQPNL